MTCVSDLSFDAELLLHFLATTPEARHEELIVQLMPTGAVNLVTDQTTADDTDWPEAINKLVEHYAHDAEERAKAALGELIERNFISKEKTDERS